MGASWPPRLVLTNRWQWWSTVYTVLLCYLLNYLEHTMKCVNNAEALAKCIDIYLLTLLTQTTLDRFYIEKITFLKDNTTVELFFLNAKSLVSNVSVLSIYSLKTYIFIFIIKFGMPFSSRTLNTIVDCLMKRCLIQLICIILNLP